jgi:hypothetical protein
MLKGLYKVPDPALQLREARNKVCFPVINRGKLWYDRLSPLQLGELKAWYQAWLDAPRTLEYPKEPEWLHDTLAEEEIVI